jgi:hypothetical protein
MGFRECCLGTGQLDSAIVLLSGERRAWAERTWYIGSEYVAEEET